MRERDRQRGEIGTYVELILLGKAHVGAASFERLMARGLQDRVRANSRVETDASQLTTKFPIETGEDEEIDLDDDMQIERRRESVLLHCSGE